MSKLSVFLHSFQYDKFNIFSDRLYTLFLSISNLLSISTITPGFKSPDKYCLLTAAQYIILCYLDHFTYLQYTIGSRHHIVMCFVASITRWWLSIKEKANKKTTLNFNTITRSRRRRADANILLLWYVKISSYYNIIHWRLFFILFFYDFLRIIICFINVNVAALRHKYGRHEPHIILLWFFI